MQIAPGLIRIGENVEEEKEIGQIGTDHVPDAGNMVPILGRPWTP